MPIAARTATSGTIAASSSGSITLPTGCTTGDYIVVALTNAGTTGGSMIPGVGWSQLYAASAGSGQFLTVWGAAYDSRLGTPSVSNAASVAAWVCNSYFQAGTQVLLDLNTNVVGATNTTNNTTMATGAPTSGPSGLDYEVLAYGWSSSATITAASGMTIDRQQANSTSCSAALGHNNTNPLPASTACTAFAPTISAASNRKSGVGLCLTTRTPPAAPSDAYGQMIDAETSLTHYWRLSQSTSPLLDYQGYADLTLPTRFMGGQSTPIADKLGLVGQDQNATGKVSCPASVILDMTAGFSWTPAWSFELWWNGGSTGSQSYVAGCEGSVTLSALAGFDLLWTTGGFVQGQIGQAGAGWAINGPTRSADVSGWHHFVLTYDGNTHIAQLWVDGVAGTATGGVTWAPNATVFALCNTAVASSATSTAGTMDEVAWYNAVLTSTQISNHYAAARGMSAAMAGQASSTGTLTLYTPPALGQSIALRDPLNQGALGASWGAWGSGTKTYGTTTGYTVLLVASQSAGTYGGFLSNV